MQGALSQAICCGCAWTVMRAVYCRKAGGGPLLVRDAGACIRPTRGGREVQGAGRGLGALLATRPGHTARAVSRAPPPEGRFGLEGGGRSCRALISAWVNGSRWACHCTQRFVSIWFSYFSLVIVCLLVLSLVIGSSAL
jgi:hypothetical protein